jgi:hypothetical protein
MIDDPPFITVDNQKIYPVNRSLGPESASGSRKEPDPPPFGIVDRVTLSRQAREQSKRLQAQIRAEAQGR